MLQVFDHYSPQKHESVHKFLENWGSCAWDDANVPVGLFLGKTDEGEKYAEVQVYHPRKEHVKSVTIIIKDDDELQMLRDSFRGVAEALYGPAASNLEHFARGDLPGDYNDDGYEGGFVLYYWKPEEFKGGAI